MIGPKEAKLTLKNITQGDIRSALSLFRRRYRGDLFYQKRRLSSNCFTDIFHSHHKALEGNTCSQFFANKQMFAVSYPLTAKRFAGEALKLFISQFGVPEDLIFDSAIEQYGKGTFFMKQIVYRGMNKYLSESHRHN